MAKIKLYQEELWPVYLIDTQEDSELTTVPDELVDRMRTANAEFFAVQMLLAECWADEL